MKIVFDNLEMALFFLFVIFFFFNNAECLLPGSDNRIISKAFRDKRFIQINTATTPLKIYSNHFNNYDDSSDESTYATNSHEEKDPNGPLNHQILHSEHEVPKDVSTYTNYTEPGKWAKPPLEKNIPLQFVPIKLYAQVRASHMIKRVPQKKVIETAGTKEEKENAARLREVVTNSKVATVYTEEGYEDSAYDHAGHVRDANFHEGYARKLHNELDHETQGKAIGKENFQVKFTSPGFKYIDDYFEDYREHVDDSMMREELESRNEGKLVNYNDKIKSNKNVEEELRNPEINPKFVTKGEISKLENENEYQNAVAEKGSEIYGAGKLTKFGYDYDYNEGNPFEHQKSEKTNSLQKPKASNITYDSNFETKRQLQIKKVTEPVYTIRPRNKFYIRTRNVKKNITPSTKNEERDKNHKSAIENSQNIPRMAERYEQTNYVTPDFPVNNPTEDYAVFTLGYMSENEIPTTINYGDVFWKYFKERQNERAALKPKIFHKEAIVNPDSITMSSNNEHDGPYLLVTENQNVLNPLTLGNLIAPELFNNLSNDPVPESTNLQWPNKTVQKTQNRDVVRQISNTFYPDIKDTTVKPWTLGKDDYNSEVLLGILKPSKPKEVPKYNSTPKYSVSPTMLNNFPSHQKTTQYDHNPFLIHYAHSAKTNIPHYTVLIRPYTDYSGTDDSISDVNLTKTKMISHHLRNQGHFRPITDNQNIRSTQDFFLLKPPLRPSLPSLSLRVVTYPNCLPHSSSMTKKIKKPEKSRNRLSVSQIENPVRVNCIKFPNNVDSTLPEKFTLSPQIAVHGKEMISMLHLRPPDPLTKSEYAEYLIRKRRSYKFLRFKKPKKEISSHNPAVAKNMRTFKHNISDMRKPANLVKKRVRRNIKNVKKFESNIVERGLRLVNESPGITDKVINDEINQKFENTGNHVSGTNEKFLNTEFENVGIETPEFDYVKENNDNNFLNSSTTPQATIDLEKYPFYQNNINQSFLTLKYIINPERVPKKTFGGMEFYESRNYLGCDEVNPNLQNVVPPEEEAVDNRDLKTDIPRLQRLGEKLDCFKAKYFDNNPLDNPLFLESQMEQPILPAELNKTKFTSGISVLPSNNDVYNSLQVSKSPKRLRIKTENRRPKKYPANYNWEPRMQRYIVYNNKIYKKKNNLFNIEKNLSTPIEKRPLTMQNHRNYEIPQSFTVKKPNINKRDFYATIPHKNGIYEDLMVNIRNAGSFYDKVKNESLSTTTFKTTSLPSIPLPIDVPFIKIAPLQLLPMKRSQNLIKYVINGEIFPESYRIQQVRKRNTRSIHFPKIVTHKILKRSITDSSLELFSSDSKKVLKKTSSKSISNIQPALRRKRKSSILKLALRKGDLNTPYNETKKVVYTINDRIKYSKPKKENGKHGRFTNESTLSEIDSRRLEPRYNPVLKRKKILYNSSLSTQLPIVIHPTGITFSTIVLPANSINITKILLNKRESKQNPPTNESINEQKKEVTFQLDIPIQRRKRVHPNTTEKSTEVEHKLENTSRNSDEIGNKYKVYEDVSEENLNTELTDNLLPDPPAIDKSVGELYEIKKFNRNGDSSDSKENTENGDDMDGRSYGSDVSSKNSEENIGNFDLEPQDKKPDVDQSSLIKGRNINEEDRTFERFDSRPFSPSENFEDEKYAELGHRIHKPAFYHPPFIIPKYERSDLGRIIDVFISGHSKESDNNGKYVYPWEEDEKMSTEEEGNESNGEETQHFTRVYGGYVYPWEKRDRIAKEKKKRHKDKYDIQRIYNIDSDVNTATSDKTDSYAYPWNRDELHSKNYTKNEIPSFWQHNSFNNENSTTKRHPIIEVSDRYRDFPFKEMNSFVSISEKNQNFPTKPLSLEVKQYSFDLIQAPKNYTKSLGVNRMKLSSAPITTSSTNNKSMSKLTIDPELIRNVTKQKKKNKRARTNLNNTDIKFDPTSMKKLKRSQIRLKQTLSTHQDNLKNLSSQVEAVTLKPSTSTLTIDPASRAIRKRSSTKSNFKISQIDRFNLKQVNTTERNNRRRGRFGSTTILPKVSVLTKISTHMNSPFTKVVTGDQEFKENVSINVNTASTRLGLSTDNGLNFDIPPPASRTIEPLSKVSKEEIITKTVYPSEDAFFDKNGNVTDNHDKTFKINRLKRLKNVAIKDQPVTETVEKVSVLMKEAPNHTYHAEKINKDCIKGIHSMKATNNKTISTNYRPQLMIPKLETEETREKMNDNRFNDEDIQREDNKEAAKHETTLTSEMLGEFEAQVGINICELRSRWINVLPTLIDKFAADEDNVNNLSYNQQTINVLLGVSARYKQKSGVNKRTRHFVEIFKEGTLLLQTVSAPDKPPRLIAIGTDDLPNLRVSIYMDGKAVFCNEPIEGLLYLHALY